MSSRDLRDEQARASAHEAGDAAYDRELVLREILEDIASSDFHRKLDARYRLEHQDEDADPGALSLAGADRVRAEQGGGSEDDGKPGYDERLFGWREAQEREDAIPDHMPRRWSA